VESRLQQLRESLYSKAATSGDFFDDGEDVDSDDEITRSAMKQQQTQTLPVPRFAAAAVGTAAERVEVDVEVDESCLVLYTDVHPGSPEPTSYASAYPAPFDGAEAGAGAGGMDVSDGAFQALRNFSCLLSMCLLIC
jgi:hypothetical protein